MVKNLLPGGSKCTQKKNHTKLVSAVGEGFDSLPRKFASKDSITNAI
jgi:hypothetical protein